MNDAQIGCIGKVRFSSMSAALKIASLSSRRKDEPRQAYHCKHCYGFHIGGALAKDRRRRNAR